MPALETIGFSATAPGATGVTASPFSGDSATIKGPGTSPGAAPLCLTVRTQAAGWVSLLRPAGNDLIRGARFITLANTTQNFAPIAPQRLSPPGEAIQVTIAGSATAGDIDRALVTLYYPALPGADQDLVDAAAVDAATGPECTAWGTLTAGTTGGWSGETALTSLTTLLRAGTRYAILGTQSSVASTIPYVRGPGTANLRIAIAPGSLADLRPGYQFYDLARLTGCPTIPVINGADAAAWFVGVSNDENAASPAVTLVLRAL
jgi:hypothetical protein